jgi:hypothetical protein
MRVQEWIGVPEDLDIDAKERRVQFRAGDFNGFGQNVDAAQICCAFGTRQISEAVYADPVCDQHRVTREPLDVTYYRKAATKVCHNGGVLPCDRRPHPVVLP